MRIEVVPATPADSQFAYEVKKAAFREYVEQVWGWDESLQVVLHRSRFKAQEFFVVWCDGDAAGVLAMESRPEQLTLNQLFLKPEVQGQGIGKACMDWVVAQAKGRTIRLSVMKVNPRARRFYEELGFEFSGESETHFQMQRKLGPKPPE